MERRGGRNRLQLSGQFWFGFREELCNSLVIARFPLPEEETALFPELQPHCPSSFFPGNAGQEALSEISQSDSPILQMGA